MIDQRQKNSLIILKLCFWVAAPELLKSITCKIIYFYK